MKLEVHTSEYMMTYGREPRGRGVWAFVFDRVHDKPWYAIGQMTYGEAKKLALAEAKRRGARFVEVAP